MKLLLEMRPALEGGHAGIPQETRLLYRALCSLGVYEVQGLLQAGGRVLAHGLPVHTGEVNRSLEPHEEVNRMSRVVVSLQPAQTERLDRWRRSLKSILSPLSVTVRSILGIRESLWAFDPTHFQDFIWRNLFSKTLPHDDLPLVTRGMFRVLCTPYGAMHMSGVLTRWAGRSVYPRLKTEGVDTMIVQTPYPGRVATSTRLIVRYPDAVPMMLPHTIVSRSFHQASHFGALRQNVRDGAYFACASEATRRDLLAMFPGIEERAVTIHCMLSHHYWPEESSPERVAEILMKRKCLDDRANLQIPLQLHDAKRPNYLLMVSTLEPRKNHLTLISAWEQLRRKCAGLKLVLVGSLGWEHEAITSAFSPWVAQGEAFLLSNVPAEELRVLYRHAAATVCPSVSEGFDYSGVEAMRCAGLVVASNLPVHREVFADAAEYFSAYSSSEAASVIEKLLDANASARREALRARGQEVAAKYLPDRLLPQWQELLERVNRRPVDDP